MIYGVPNKRRNTNSLVLGCTHTKKRNACKKENAKKKKKVFSRSIHLQYVWMQPPASHKLCFINVNKSNIYFNKQFN